MTRPHLELLEGSSGWASELLDAWSRRLEEKSMRRKRTAAVVCGGGGFYGSNKRVKRDVGDAVGHPKGEIGRRVVMFHRISSVWENRAAVEGKSSRQTRYTSDSAGDMDAHILSLYKK